MLALFDQTIFTTPAGALPRDGPPARPRRVRGAAAVVRAVPAMGHVGRRRSRRQPGRHRRRDAAAMAIQSDHALRGLEAATRRIARTLSVSERDVPPDAGAPPGARPRRATRCPDAARELDSQAARRAPPAALGLAAHRLAATRTGARGALRRPRARSCGTSTCCSARSTPAARRGWRGASCSTCAGRPRRSGSTWRRWRCASTPRAAAARERSSRRGTRRAAVGRRPARSSPTFRAIADIQARARAARLRAGDRELHAVGRRPRRRPRARPGRRPRGPAGRRARPAVRVAARARHAPPRSWRSGSRCPVARRLLRRRDGELEVMVGYSDSAKEVGMLAANLELYGAQRSMAAWARDRGLRLTIFHGRGGALGRGGGPASRAIAARAAGLGRRAVQGHRTRRGGVRAIREPGARAPPPGADDERRRARTPRPRRRRRPRRPVRARDRRDGRAPRDAHYEALVHAEGFVEFFRRVTPIAPDRNAADRLAAGLARLGDGRRRSRTCARSRGCSRGARAA